MTQLFSQNGHRPAMQIIRPKGMDPKDTTGKPKGNSVKDIA